MRNLRAIGHDVCPAAAGATAICWDAARDEAIVAFGPSAEEARVQLARVAGEQCRDLAAWDAVSPQPELAVDRIVSLHYFGDLATACVVMAGGDIVVVREGGAEGGGQEAHIEIVGSVDPGIAAAGWSPDEEVLAVVTAGPEAAGDGDSKGTLLLMSRSFETIGETVLTRADLAASKHVSVGWGKKETQFRGRGAAKALRDPTIPERVDVGRLGPEDSDGRVSVSWRGDGEYVAVNGVTTTDEGIQRRVVRVYNREGVLDSASEPVDGLAASLSWRPAGNLIAGVQKKDKEGADSGFSVVFFERNGLRHGQFSLRRDDAPVSLAWNPDSSVLAVGYADAVQLWTMGNYHWYLKQELPTGPRAHAVAAWHPEKPLRLAVAAADGVVRADYIATVARGAVAPPHDHGAVAVIDGRSVKLTPFRAASVPPPMSLFDVEVAGCAVDVAFSADDAFCAVLHARGLDIFAWTWPSTGKRPPPPKKVAAHAFSADDLPSVPLQVCFQAESSGILLLRVLGWQDGLGVTTFRLSGSELTADPSPLSLPDGSILTPSNRSSIYAQDAQGSLSLLSESGAHDVFPGKLPTLLPWAEVVETEGGGRVAVGLSRGGQLYANERLLAKNVSSFVVTAAHVIFTTGSSQLLKFVHVDAELRLEVPADDPETDERCRQIERGARVVTAVPSNLSVVLQMPRGNVETVFPRAMVVAGIRGHIDRLEYGAAFAVCRTQRVDMNLLYDHKPAQFLSHVGRFLDQVGEPASVDLFLSSLRAEDVTQTMYRDTQRGAETGSEEAAPSSEAKVNAICDAVLAALGPRRATHLLNTITAHVCKAPPAIDDGLRAVAALRTGGSAAERERAVEHICFLVDVNRLYEHALGLYDLELTMLVAQQAQRDPREYAPFVQALHGLPELRRRFTIDDHLGRHAKALGHLQALGAFDEVQAYTVKHGLYQTALQLYRYDSDQLQVLTGLYADHLEQRSRFREAGLAHESIGQLAQATRCYQSAGAACWRECLFAAQMQQQPPLSAAQLRQLASTLADALAEARDFTSAATVQLEHLGSVEGAVRCLCKGYAFAEATRLVAHCGQPALLATAVDPGLSDALASSTELLADCRAQLQAQVPRILELRRKAREDPLAFFEGDRGGGGGGDDVPDDVSVAASSRLSTGASLFTRYSTATGATGATGQTGLSTATAKRRSKRREEKKRARGRKGTVYEQAYLVASVRRLVDRVERARDEVAALVVALTRRGRAEQARAIERLMTALVTACQAAIQEVWPGAAPGGPAADEPDVLDSLDGTQPAPVMAAFAQLSLLGEPQS